MKTFLYIALGFVLGVISTIGVLFVIAALQNTEENQLRDEIRTQALQNLKQSMGKLDANDTNSKNIQSFELSTKKGIVKLHTYMSKDSVQILMGRPGSTDIYDTGFGEVIETWRYKGTNRYVDEFTIEFSNGELKSVRQFKDH